MNKKKFREITANIFVLLVTLMFIVVVAERISDPIYKREHKDHLPVSLFGPIKGFQHPPNSIVRFGNTTRKFNSFGFGDYEFHPKMDNTTRIIFVGDSFTFGEGETLNNSYPKILEKKLRKENKNIEVYNLGLGGLNTYHESAVINYSLKKLNPDYIVVGFFLNDLDTEFILESEKCTKIDGPTSLEFTKLVKERLILPFIYPESTKVDFSFYVLNQYKNNPEGWYCFDTALKRIKRMENEHDVPVVFFLIDIVKYENKMYYDYRNKIKEYLDKNNIKYVDVQDYEYTYEDIYNELEHYNVYGNKIIADIMFNYFNKVILEEDEKGNQ